MQAILIEIDVCNGFYDNMVMDVHKLEGPRYTKETIRVEYEQGGNNEGTKNFKSVLVKPKTIYQPKVNHSTDEVSPKMVPSAGKKKVTKEIESSNKASTPGMQLEGKIQLLDEKCVLVYDDGKALEKVDYSGDHDSEDKVKPIENEMASYLASIPSGVGDGQDFPEMLQPICDNLDIKGGGDVLHTFSVEYEWEAPSNSFEALNVDSLIIEEVATGSKDTTSEHKVVFLDDNGKGLKKVDYPDNLGNEDEVEPIDTETASYLASKLRRLDMVRRSCWNNEGKMRYQGSWSEGDIDLFDVNLRHWYEQLCENLIEIDACNGFCDNLVMDVHKLEGPRYTKETIRVEYEWKHPRCCTRLIFGHSISKAPKRVLLDGKCVLMDDDDVKHLEKVDYSGDHDSEDKVQPIENEMGSSLASIPSGVGYGTKSLLEQRNETYENVDYDYDLYDNDIYKGQDFLEMLQSICDNLDIKGGGDVLHTISVEYEWEAPSNSFEALNVDSLIIEELAMGSKDTTFESKVIFLDDNGKGLEKVDYPNNLGSEDEVEPIDTET
nr:hypothetical protein [Tanacetum cinerariifolium]